MGQTSVKLCGPSAFHYWHLQRMASICPEQPLFRVLEEQLVAPRDCAHLNMLQGDAPTDRQIGSLLAGPLRNLKPPVHVLVPHRDGRRPSRLKTCHVWEGPLPRGALVKVNDDLYVSSPAFCFLQLAPSLSLIDLVQLGDEMCGTYVPYEYGEEGIERCPPLTARSALASFVERAPGRRGVKKALRAVAHVVHGSASPQETALEMILCLPLLLGGNAIPVPAMNRCIDMAHAVQRPWDGDLCMGDLTWADQRLVVEYNGKMSHKGRRERDDLRRNRLASMGYTVIDVYERHLVDPVETEMLVGQVVRRLGRKIDRRGRTEAWARRSAALRRLVAPGTALACQRVLAPPGSSGGN